MLQVGLMSCSGVTAEGYGRRWGGRSSRAAERPGWRTGGSKRPESLSAPERTCSTWTSTEPIRIELLETPAAAGNTACGTFPLVSEIQTMFTITEWIQPVVRRLSLHCCFDALETHSGPHRATETSASSLILKSQTPQTHRWASAAPYWLKCLDSPSCWVFTQKHKAAKHTGSLFCFSSPLCSLFRIDGDLIRDNEGWRLRSDSGLTLWQRR